MADLTTLAVIRQALPKLAAVPDAEITRLIGEVTSAVESETGRSFGPGSFDEVYDSTGGGRLFLRNRPVAAITSISTGEPDNPAVVDPATYRFDPRTGEVRVGNGGCCDPFDGWGNGFWAGLYGYDCGFQTTRVVYTRADPVPPALAGLAIGYINRMCAANAANPGVKSASWGNVSYSFADWSAMGGLNDAERRALSAGRFKAFSLG